MKFFKLFIVSICLIFICSCSSPKDANKENFKEAINAFYTKNDIFIKHKKSRYPVTIKVDSNKPFSRNLNKEDLKECDALVSVGFLDVEKGMIKEEDYSVFMTFGAKKKMRNVVTKTYTLTEKGKNALSENGFFIGKLRVKEIIRFTEPKQLGEYTVLKVYFIIESYDLSDLAKNNNIINAFPYINKKVKENKKSTKLFLMNDG